MSPNGTDGMANSVDPDQSDLGLHCLPRPVCPKTYKNYGIFFFFVFFYVLICNKTLYMYDEEFWA